ncbi:hypothetical protein ABZ619_07150 [Streptomyces sp. NPDC007851]|uniref:hypothetical protein n=1 Tax=Streptomyces sp. NPDC007851 TaxID=3155008 RepID=UPI0033DA36C7
MQVPAPSSAKERTAELHQDQALAKTRTAAGKKAATWLELHGKKDIWKLYLHDQRELIPTAQGNAEKAELKAALKLAKTISDQLAAKDKQPAPFVLDPTLRSDKQHSAGEYEWMRAEVLCARVYMAGHVPSGLTAGTLLGDLIGDFEPAIDGH